MQARVIGFVDRLRHWVLLFRVLYYFTSKSKKSVDIFILLYDVKFAIFFIRKLYFSRIRTNVRFCYYTIDIFHSVKDICSLVDEVLIPFHF